LNCFKAWIVADGWRNVEALDVEDCVGRRII